MDELTEILHHSRREQSRRRLTATLPAAALIVALVLALIPVTIQVGDFLADSPVVELELLAEQPAVDAEPQIEELVEEPVEEPVEEFAETFSKEATEELVEAPVESEPEDEAQLDIDWHELIESYAGRSEEFADTDEASLSPHFDELRSVAALRYSKPMTREKKKIWENTEIDQMGRTILRSGNCSRVIAEPSAVRQWEFETFGQYIVTCSSPGGAPPVELAWVDDVVERYAYLENFRGHKNY